MNKVKLILLLIFFLPALARTQPKGYLVVVNKPESTVSVINIGKATSVKVAVGHAPHEAAASPSGKIAAVSNYGDGAKVGNTISIIDVLSAKKIKDIDLGIYQRPHGMEFINDEELVVTCEKNQMLLRVHAGTGAVSEVANTSQQGSHMVDYISAGSLAYITNVFSGTVSVLDVNGKKLNTVINMKKGIEGLAVSPDGKELWLANREDSSVVIINTATSEQVAVLPTGQLPFRVAFQPAGNFAFVANAVSSSVSVYDARQHRLIGHIPLKDAQGKDQVPLGLTVSSDGKYLYVTAAAVAKAIIIDIVSRKVVGELESGVGPDGICFLQG